MLDVGCWMLDVGNWKLEIWGGGQSFGFQVPAAFYILHFFDFTFRAKFMGSLCNSINR